MNRYERRIYFDRLLALRDAYRHLGSDDTTVALSIGEAIEHAARLLETPTLAGATLESEADAGWG